MAAVQSSPLAGETVCRVRIRYRIYASYMVFDASMVWFV